MAYITDFNPFIPSDIDYEKLVQIETLVKEQKSLTKEEACFLLDHICYFTRYLINPQIDNFKNKYDLAQSILYYYFDALDCRQIPTTTQGAITNSIIGHNFLVLELIIDEVPTLYLVDPTYIQFFDENDCSLQKFYVSPLSPDKVLITPNPGFFIKNSQKPRAMYLLNHGYSFFNTKTGVSLSNWRYQTMSGEIYTNAFVKSPCRLSKTYDELKRDEMLLYPFSLLQTK